MKGVASEVAFSVSPKLVKWEGIEPSSPVLQTVEYPVRHNLLEGRLGIEPRLVRLKGECFAT